MKAGQIYEVLEALIGNVEPYADSAIDAKRFENMEKLIYVFREMHTVIDRVAYNHKNSPFASAKKIGKLASKQLDDMGIVE